MGSGAFIFGFCTTLLDMDFNAIINPIIEFFSTDLGAVIAQISRTLFDLLFPSNTDAAVVNAG
ncbi:hypothetical protein YH66_14770 [[Brevibacterium] flavum]|uniref:Uncharacterized protein n=2 Tax=Corynebacterium TaxID=1716 RepID=A0A0F6Z6W1_9CORY|nr:hypothetical protein C624_14545 [Corynebacterium glutamicum SCgG1]AGN23499.1 hypothetical protein C629_14555 [Corynebacterium glutamicum SCgG2]AJE68529.1 hypothetical protein SB89_13905 [Corynebacterium glutamicum]AKF28700.1 hypothetical protein YH66_14770 [[Brevibacterium] flavum]ANR63817.1 hypothetical protein C628_14665 [[Brevibacterium] flavum ZL-1]ANR66825.1 hypothetical protein C627_14530 [Corynebacterium glutamicum ZL-6]AST21943.1 hypothetical protein CEY17_15030 [Corynebacterium gl